jgi:hypothetical protein
LTTKINHAPESESGPSRSSSAKLNDVVGEFLPIAAGFAPMVNMDAGRGHVGLERRTGVRMGADDKDCGSQDRTTASGDCGGGSSVFFGGADGLY